MSTQPTPRADAVLKNLPPDRQHEIFLRRTEGKNEDRGQDAIRDWLAQDGIKVSRRALSEFLSWYASRQDLQATGDLLETFEEFTRKQNPTMSADKVREIAVQFFMAHTVAKQDVGKFVSVAQLDQNERFGKTKAKLDERKVQVSERRQALLERKAAQADAAARVTGDSKLTPEQKDAEYRRIFGMS